LVTRLPEVLLYLRLPSLWAVLLGLALITMVLDAMSFGYSGGLLGLLIAGLEIGVFFQITRSSAQGDKTLEAPDFVSIYDSVVQPIILVVVAALPMLVAGYIATEQLLASDVPRGDWPMGPLVLFLAGIALYPLLLTIAAIDRDAMRVLNPVIWLQSLASLGTSYLVASAVFYGLWAIEAYVIVDIAFSITSSGVFGASLPALMLLYVPRVLRYRLLGALCEPFLSQPIEHVVMVPEAELPTAEYDNSHELLEELESGAMTSRAILRMANTAYSKKRPRLVYRAVEHLWKHHPDSPEVVQALWVASQAQELEGHTGAMKSTLEKLVAHHPNHPMAGEARLKLRRL
jgi:hypothetical protein